MDNINKITRNKLKEIPTKKELEDLVDKLILSDDERNIILMHYRDKKPLSYIADIIGITKSSVNKKHKSALLKISKIMEE